MTRQTIPLEMLRIASPCHAAWDEMAGTDRMRFCHVCQETVYDLLAMTRNEAENLIRQSNGKTCVRLYRRSDGRVLTRDCPVGLQAARRLRLALATVATCWLALLAWGAALIGLNFASESDRHVPTYKVSPRERPEVIMGRVPRELCMPPEDDGDIL
jgi:hypothetical protein